MANLFNVGAFFILFRESMEAVIILIILLRFVDRMSLDVKQNAILKKQVWLGTITGVVLSLSVGIALTIVFYILGRDLFGQAEPVWEGTLKLLATLLLTWLAFKMLNIDHLVSKWEKKITKATVQADIIGNAKSSSSTFMNSYGLGVLSFTVVVREGLEAVIFIAGVGSSEPISLILPSILGFFSGIFVGWLLYKGSAKLNLHWFFKISCWVLLVISAGLSAGCAHEFEEYHYIKLYEGQEEGTFPESSPVLWDWSECCSEKNNGFFQVMSALIGWRSVATVATVIAYFGYWLLVGLIFLVIYLRTEKEVVVQEPEVYLGDNAVKSPLEQSESQPTIVEVS